MSINLEDLIHLLLLFSNDNSAHQTVEGNLRLAEGTDLWPLSLYLVCVDIPSVS